MTASRSVRSVALALTLIAALLPSQAASQPAASGRCLDVEGEVSEGRTGSPTYLVATIRKRTTGSSACNGPIVEKGGPSLVSFELTGANDPEGTGIGSDSPESPDAMCDIRPDYYIEARCVVGLWGEEEGVATVRAWIDDDRENPPRGIVEADRTEGVDKAAEPGDGCLSGDSPTSLGQEPDCTDVVEIDWRDRPACEPATEPSGAGDRIAVYRYGQDVEAGLYTVDHRGGDPRLIGAPDDLRDYLWSPDHGKLAISTGYINSLELSVMNADGSRTTRLTDNFLLDEGAAWSPDSRQLVYASYNYRRNDPSQLKIVGANGRGTRWLTRGKADSTQPDWAPNGKNIVYARYKIGSPTVGSIATIDSDGDHRRTLVRDKTILEYPQFSPNGKTVLYRKHMDDAARDLFTVDARGHVERLTDAGALVNDFQWSPDGRKIVYETLSDTGWHELHVMNADGSGDHEIVRHFGLEVWLSPSWSPDSSTIAYQLNYRTYDPNEPRHLSDVWLSSADGTCSQAITSTPDVTETAPSWITPASTSNPFEF